MRKPARETAVLTVRVPRALDRRLAAEARRRRQTRSATARALLEGALQGPDAPDLEGEARRQSRLASARESDGKVLDLIAHAADLRGWK
jgi:hypothetical protein